MAALEKIIENCVEGLGYELIDIEFVGGGLLRVSIDRPNSDPRALLPIQDESIQRINVEDCESVSRQLSHLLMVEDIEYKRLEIASPGLDRPLRKARDFERFAGFTVSIKLRVAYKGRRNFEGVLAIEGQLPGETDGAEKFALELNAEPLHGIKGLSQLKALNVKNKGKPVVGKPGVGKPGIRGAKSIGMIEKLKGAEADKPLSKTALKKIAVLEAKAQLLAQQAGLTEMSGHEELVTKLVFSIDELERARLVPVV